MFATASGDIISAGGDGGPQGPVFNVTLVGPTSAPSPKASEIGGAGLEPLLAKLHRASEGSPTPFSPEARSHEFSRMVERFQQADRSTTHAQPMDTPTHSLEFRAPTRPSPMPANTITSGQAVRPAAGERAGSASAGELWARIEPCWRNLSTPVDRPVTLEVTLNALAALSRPPTVIRPGDARLDEPRLRSEARALEALQACLPRGEPRFALRVYRLEFGVTP